MLDFKDMVMQRCDEIAIEDFGVEDFYELPEKTQQEVWEKAEKDTRDNLALQAEHYGDLRENR